jgi:FixJ family two-component response regulator
MGAAPVDQRTIGVVDDDELVGTAIGSLLRSLGLKVRMCGSAVDLLGSPWRDANTCLITDVRSPAMSGVDVQRPFLAAKREFPIIFLSAHDDPVARQQALAAGALAFLRKPFSEEDLVGALRAGLARATHRSNP